MNWLVIGVTTAILLNILGLGQFMWWFWRKEREDRVTATVFCTVVILAVETMLGGIIAACIEGLGWTTTFGVTGVVVGIPTVWFGGIMLLKGVPHYLAQWWLREKEISQIKEPKFASIDAAFNE